MKQEYDRWEEIRQWMQSHMEERFQESCREIQEKLEDMGNVMWNELRGRIQEVLLCTADMQRQGQKGKIAYVVCSFLQCSIDFNRLLLRIETLEEGLYLDDQEAAGYYCPKLLQDHYQEDLEFLYQKAYGEFVRVQDYELEEISQAYAEYYNALIYDILQSVSGLISRTVSESGICLSDDFQIVYGEYMGDATVLWAKEKREHEVLPDGNK